MNNSAKFGNEQTIFFFFTWQSNIFVFNACRDLADIRKNGFLDESEFIIAMHYIAKLMDKSITTLPSILPPDVYLAATGGGTATATTGFVSSPKPMSPPLLQSRAKKIDTIGNMAFSNAPATAAWDVTAHEKAQYDTFFTKLDRSGKGVINGAEAVEFFKNSNLPETELAKIWDLADIGHTGTLNRNEFAIAMHLIHARLTGGTLPAQLPPSLKPPPTPVLPTLSNPTSPTTSRGFSLSSPAVNNGMCLIIKDSILRGS